MRKIKLQMTSSIDGFVKPGRGSEESLWDDQVTEFCIRNLDNVDDILLGRTTTEGFIPYWAEVAANPKDEFYQLGRLLTDIPKLVFSSKPKAAEWNNATVVGGDLKAEVKKIKSGNGKDIMVYGGVSFVSSLIQHGLVDEFHFLIYPYAAGTGASIFNKIESNALLTLKTCKAFPSGIVLLGYEKR